ncbi:MAG: discoidin domain-containing protein [Candidatus Aenigmarchaeota archaeon]|nr:discoidin domain-containing protein [Candidatus Aenigmarchaeota archaeon]
MRFAKALLLVILAFFLLGTPIYAQPAAQPPGDEKCGTGCQQLYGVGGSCSDARDYVGAKQLHPDATLCAREKPFCYCEISRDLACNSFCKKNVYPQGGGTCTPANQVSSGGYVTDAEPFPEVACGTSSLVCACYKFEDDIWNDIRDLGLFFILPVEKECRPVGGQNYYIATVRGLWFGGQALQVNVRGSGQLGAAQSGLSGFGLGSAGFGQPGSVSGTTAFGEGPFSANVFIPKSVIEQNDFTLPIEYRIVPYPSQLRIFGVLQQTLGSSYPPLYPGTPGYIPQPSLQSYDTLSRFYTMPDTLRCEQPLLPEPPQFSPPTEGPKPISIRSIQCAPPAEPRSRQQGISFQNPWHLVDLDRDSYFQFAPSDESAPLPQFATPSLIPNPGTGQPGTAPPGREASGQEADQQPNATSAKAKQAFCTIEFDQDYPHFGLSLETWDRNDNITLTKITAGLKTFEVNKKLGTGQKEFVQYFDFSSVPVNARVLRLEFNYTGSPVLREIDPFPDTMLIADFNVTPTATFAGEEIEVKGAISRRTFKSSGGTKPLCIYQIDGTCEPCIGNDCSNKPTWALLPASGTMLEGFSKALDSVNNWSRDKLGVVPAPPTVDMYVPASINQNELFATILASSVHGWLTEAFGGGGAMQRLFQGVFGFLYIQAIEDAQRNHNLELDKKVAVGEIQQEQKDLVPTQYCTANTPIKEFFGINFQFCKIRFIIFTWWTFDSLPMAHSTQLYDLADYSLAAESCQKPSKFDIYWANAGFWSFMDTMAGMVEQIQDEAAQRRTAAQRAIASQSQTCDECLTRSPDNARALASCLSSVDKFGIACVDNTDRRVTTPICDRDDDGSILNKKCEYIENGQTVRTDPICPQGKSSVTSREQCSSTFPIVPGKWCATPIKELNGQISGVSGVYVPLPGGGNIPKTGLGRCVLSSDSCSAGEVEITTEQYSSANSCGLSQSELSKQWSAAEFAKLGSDCLKCVEARGTHVVWKSDGRVVRECVPLDQSPREGQTVEGKGKAEKVVTGGDRERCEIAKIISDTAVVRERIKVETQTGIEKNKVFADLEQEGTLTCEVCLSPDFQRDHNTRLCLKVEENEVKGECRISCDDLNHVSTTKPLTDPYYCTRDLKSVAISELKIKCTQFNSCINRLKDRADWRALSGKVDQCNAAAEALDNQKVKQIAGEMDTFLTGKGADTRTCRAAELELTQVSGTPVSRVPASQVCTKQRGDYNNYETAIEEALKNANNLKEVVTNETEQKALIAAIISWESSWNPYAISPKNAHGLMQIVNDPAISLTWDTYCKDIGVFPGEPADNIKCGVRYFDALISGAVSGKEACEGSVRNSLAGYNSGGCDWTGADAPAETREYVPGIMSYWDAWKSCLASPPVPPAKPAPPGLQWPNVEITKITYEKGITIRDLTGKWYDLDFKWGAHPQADSYEVHYLSWSTSTPKGIHRDYTQIVNERWIQGQLILEELPLGDPERLLIEITALRGNERLATTRLGMDTGKAHRKYNSVLGSVEFTEEGSDRIIIRNLYWGQPGGASAVVYYNDPGGYQWYSETIYMSDEENTAVIETGETSNPTMIMVDIIPDGQSEPAASFSVDPMPYGIPKTILGEETLGKIEITRLSAFRDIRTSEETVSIRAEWLPVTGVDSYSYQAIMVQDETVVEACFQELFGDETSNTCSGTSPPGFVPETAEAALFAYDSSGELIAIGTAAAVFYAISAAPSEVSFSDEPLAYDPSVDTPATFDPLLQNKAELQFGTRYPAGSPLPPQPVYGTRDTRARPYEMLARSYQTQFFFQMRELLTRGESIYRRSSVRQPGLGAGFEGKCEQLDTVGSLGVHDRTRQVLVGKLDHVLPLPSEYHTIEGAIVPETADVDIIVIDQNGTVVENSTIQANFTGAEGVFTHRFVVPMPGNYLVLAKPASEVSSPGLEVISAQDRPPPAITSQSAVCSPEGVPAEFALTITEPAIQSSSTEYLLEVLSPQAGAGFVAISGEGASIEPAASVVVNPDSTVAVPMQSSSPGPISVRITNNKGFSTVKQTNHQSLNNADVDIRAKISSASQSSLREWGYPLVVNSSVPQGCAPYLFALQGEAPGSGWTSDFETPAGEPVGAVDLSKGQQELIMNVFPTGGSIGTYTGYAMISESLPEPVSSEIAADALFIATDQNNFIYYTTTEGRLRSVSTGGATGIDYSIGSLPGGIALDSGNIYFAAAGAISKTAKNAFTPSDMARGIGNATHVAVDNQNAYWLDGGKIKRVVLNANAQNCAGANCLFASASAKGLALDSRFVYYTEDDSVKRIPKDGGSEEILYKNKAGINDVFVAGDDIYAAVNGGTGKGKIVKIAGDGTPADPLSGGSNGDVPIAIGRPHISSIAVYSNRIYWSESGAIYSSSLSQISDYEALVYAYQPGAPLITIVPGRMLAPAGEAAEYDVRIDNLADTALTLDISLSEIPAGWSISADTSEVSLQRKGASGDSQSFKVEVASPPGAQISDSINWCVTAKTTGISGQACSSYVISQSLRPSVSWQLAEGYSLPARPRVPVAFDITVKNENPPEFAAQSPVNVEFDVPDGWEAEFVFGNDFLQEINAEFGPQESLQMELFITPSRTAVDGDHKVFVVAELGGGVRGVAEITIPVKGCGNYVCEPERGETSQSCAADCSFNAGIFKCPVFGSGAGFDYYTCMQPKDNTTEMSVDIALEQTLFGQEVRACRRGATPEQCLASQCGITRTGISGTLKDCAAELDPTGRGVFGDNYNNEVACPTDVEDDIYFYIRGEDVTGTNIQSYRSVNYSFACPFYNLERLASAASRWSSIVQNCPSVVARRISEGERVCADILKEACAWREDHLQLLDAALLNPSKSSIESLLEDTESLEERIQARIATSCIGIPGLEILGIVPPGTFVGETAKISMSVANSFGEDYRGFASCEVARSDGTMVEPKSSCTLFRSGETPVEIPIFLDSAGTWTINSCTVHGDLASAISEQECEQAPEFSSKNVGMSFTVTAPETSIVSPREGAVLSGTASVEAVIRGTFDEIDFSVSANSRQCAGAPLFSMQAEGSGDKKTYTAAWNTASFADKSYWLCVIAKAGTTSTFLGSVFVAVNNYDFLLQPSSEQKTVSAPVDHEITITNTGFSDSYSISCTSNASATLQAGSSTKQCGAGQIQASIQTGNSLVAKISLPKRTSLTTLTVINNQSEQKQSILIITEGQGNLAPAIANARAEPSSVQQGGSVKFYAELRDAESDNITRAEACLDSICSEKLCTMSRDGAGYSCTAAVGKNPGSYTWYVSARDSAGSSSTSAVQQLVVTPPGGGCAYTCLPSCTDNVQLCLDREQREGTCTAGTVCCRENTMPACTPSQEGCGITIEKSTCVFDPVKQKYVASVQAVRTGGNYTVISVSGVQSQRLYAESMSYQADFSDSDPKSISIGVYGSTYSEPLICSETGTIICGGAQDFYEPAGLSLSIANAFAKSSAAGFGPTLAIDSDPSTFWESPLPAWIKVDLSQEMSVNGIGIYSQIDRPRSFSIEVSKDDSTYLEVADVDNAQYERDWNVTYFGPATARWVRINIDEAERADRSIVKIFELRVYGTRIGLAGDQGAGGAAQGEFPWALAAVIAIVIIVVIVILINREKIRLWIEYKRS